MNSERQSARPRRGWWPLLWKSAAAGAFVLAFLVYFLLVLPFWGVPFNSSRHGSVPLTPPWALECWLWEDDVNTGAEVEELLAGYVAHDIPVRTIMIDSPWSQAYNDFRVDESRYPQPERFFRGLQDQGFRVVLWMTCMVNSYNKDTSLRESPEFFAEASRHGYLAGGDYQLKWWKGRGGFIDYTNPEAMAWWRGLQKQVLDWGVDGWKLDGCDTLFSRRLGKLPLPFNQTHQGWISTRTYMDLYAREEYRHGLSRNPEFATLIRAVDGPWAHPEGFAPLDAAPVTWVGDNRHTWSEKDRGLQAAIRDVLNSARLGYCVIGSDVGGYHGRSNPDDISTGTAAQLAQWEGDKAKPSAAQTLPADDPIAPNVYIRWAQFSAFCGLFLNGGHGERRLWKRTPAELVIIRKFSWLHTELVPYMYSHIARCHQGGPPLMRPLSQGRFHYLFGDDFLVAPICEDKSAWTVSLPAGRWRYLFDDAEVIAGPTEITRNFPLGEFPVFVRDDAIVPLRVSRPYTGFGDTNSSGATTWLIYPNAARQFTLFHPEGHPNPSETTVKVDPGKVLEIQVSGKKERHILRVCTVDKPKQVMLDGQELTDGASWNYDAHTRRLTIAARGPQVGKYTITWN